MPWESVELQKVKTCRLPYFKIPFSTRQWTDKSYWVHASLAMTLPPRCKFEFHGVADLPIIQHAAVSPWGGRRPSNRKFSSKLKSWQATTQNMNSSSTGWTLLWGDFTIFINPSSHPQMPEVH